MIQSETKSKLSVFDVESIRKEFPILNQKVNGKPLIYLDNAATSQKPKDVINTISDYYSTYNANIHRGVHALAEKATNAFEVARNSVKNLINANSTEEIIFTYGTTDSINLLSTSFGLKYLNPGDEIIISGMEHHSNIVPWQLICERTGAKLKVIQITDSGEIDYDSYLGLLSDKTRLVSITHVSNSLGTINPIKSIITDAHRAGAKVMIDGAQAMAHHETDVQDLDCDFYAFSSHKMFGPTGVGILFGKKELLSEMPPYRGGGEMIKEVTFEKTTYNDLPYKFEAGTPNIADVIGFNSAMNWIKKINKAAAIEYENNLLVYATEKLESIEGLQLVGTAANKIGILSFLVEGIHPFDIGMMLDASGIAVRTGHHCTQPLMDRYKIEGTIRASFALYNTFSEVDIFVEKLESIIKRMK